MLHGQKLLLMLHIDNHRNCKGSLSTFARASAGAVMTEFGKINDGLVQDCSNSSALAMELLQSCTKPSIYSQDRYSNCLPEHFCDMSHMEHYYIYTTDWTKTVSWWLVSPKHQQAWHWPSLHSSRERVNNCYLLCVRSQAQYMYHFTH